MTYFRNLFAKLVSEINSVSFQKEKRVLGRWSMNYSQEYLDRKIYLANHDHCGPCGSLSELPILRK